MNERQQLPKQWVLVLDEYEAVNLSAVLADINEHSQRYNTGDWVNQIRWKLPHSIQGMHPLDIRNTSEESPLQAVARVLGVDSTDMSEEAQAVIDAWVIEGPEPRIHHKAQQELKKDWPYLHTAIVDLVAAYTTPGVVDLDAMVPVSTATVGIKEDQDARWLGESWLQWQWRLYWKQRRL